MNYFDHFLYKIDIRAVFFYTASMIFKDIHSQTYNPLKNGNSVLTFPPQRRSEYTLFYFSGGEGNLFSEKKRHPILPNTMITVFPRKPVKIEFSNTGSVFTFYRILFTFKKREEKEQKLFFSRLKKYPVYTFVKDRHFDFEELKHKIYTGTEDMLFSATHHLFTLYYESFGTPGRNHNHRKYNGHVEKAVAYMREHLNSKLTLTEIARHLNLSEEYFNRLFKQCTGFPPMKYFSKMKIETATEMLTDDKLPVYAVAEQLDFCSESHFSKTFKKYMKISPSTYKTDYISLLELRHQLSQEELSEAYTFIQNLINSSPDLIFYKDTRGTIIGCNQAFCTLMGKTEKEIIGQNDTELFPPEMAKFFYKKDQIVLQGKKPINNEEWMSYPNGRKRLFEVAKAPYFDTDGNVRGLIGISRDITDRKRSKEALSRAKKEAEQNSLKTSALLQKIQSALADYQKTIAEMRKTLKQKMKKASAGEILMLINAEDDLLKKLKEEVTSFSLS